MMWLVLALTGGMAGILAGLFGVGGGIIIVPALVLLLKMPQHTAAALSLIALMLPLGPAVAVYQYYAAEKITGQHFIYGVLISLGLAMGAYFGSKYALTLDQRTLQRGFAVFLICIATLMWVRS